MLRTLLSGALDKAQPVRQTGIMAAAGTDQHLRINSLSRLLLAAALMSACPARAETPAVRIIANNELDFGTFMVFGSGARTVSASGAVSDVALVALEGRTPAPARFTVLYDRGNSDSKAINIELELVMSTTPPVRMGGVEGRLSAFETSLPQALRIQPGQAIRLSMRNCRTRICSQSFQLGARLDVTRQNGGADLVIPIPFDVTVISADEQRPGQGNL